MTKTNVNPSATLGSQKDLMMFLKVGYLKTTDDRWNANINGWYNVATNAAAPYAK